MASYLPTHGPLGPISRDRHASNACQKAYRPPSVTTRINKSISSLYCTLATVAFARDTVASHTAHTLHSLLTFPTSEDRSLRLCVCVYVCVFITARLSTKLFAWGGGDVGGHVLRETTSRGLCGLVCPSRTIERRGEGDCVKEGGGGKGKCERERALERLRCYSPGH